MSLGMLAPLVMMIFLVGVIFQQSKKIKILREENTKALPNESNDELIILIDKKLKTVGEVKTIKFLREEKGMSMIDAKHFVDIVKND